METAVHTKPRYCSKLSVALPNADPALKLSTVRALLQQALPELRQCFPRAVLQGC